MLVVHLLDIDFGEGGSCCDGVKQGQMGSNRVQRGLSGSKRVKWEEAESKGSNGFHPGMSSTGACRPPGHVIHQGMSFTGACYPPGHVVHGSIVSRSIVSLGHSVTRA